MNSHMDFIKEQLYALTGIPSPSGFTKKVTDYLEKGGKALITTNFQYKDLTNFESILKAYGIERVDGIVMENDSSYYYNNIPYYLLPEVESNDYTSSVSGKYIFAPYSEAFSYDGSSDDVTYTALLQTTDKAVSKIDADNATTSEKEDGDIDGPFNLAVAAEETLTGHHPRSLWQVLWSYLRIPQTRSYREATYRCLLIS